jgi:MoaA/NifB/PqqE/SkfB family radical SAM enzyme
MHDTLPRLDAIRFPPLTRGALTTLQVNLGYRCNQSCFHCHVNAGPNRTEAMDRPRSTWCSRCSSGAG